MANFRWLFYIWWNGAWTSHWFSHLHLTNLTSKLFQWWKTSGKWLKEGIHSCTVRSSQTVQSAPLPGWRGTEKIPVLSNMFWYSGFVRLKVTCIGAKFSRKDQLWFSYWADSRNQEGSISITSDNSMGPIPGELWKSPCLECTQNTHSIIWSKSNITYNWSKEPTISRPHESCSLGLYYSCEVHWASSQVYVWMSSLSQREDLVAA